jgi:hypothetical protein
MLFSTVSVLIGLVLAMIATVSAECGLTELLEYSTCLTDKALLISDCSTAASFDALDACVCPIISDLALCNAKCPEQDVDTSAFDDVIDCKVYFSAVSNDTVAADGQCSSTAKAGVPACVEDASANLPEVLPIDELPADCTEYSVKMAVGVNVGSSAGITGGSVVAVVVSLVAVLLM